MRIVDVSFASPDHGYAINLARDFGPRFANALLPIADSGTWDWGPLIGGALAGGVMRVIGFSSEFD